MIINSAFSIIIKASIKAWKYHKNGRTFKHVIKISNSLFYLTLFKQHKTDDEIRSLLLFFALCRGYFFKKIYRCQRLIEAVLLYITLSLHISSLQCHLSSSTRIFIFTGNYFCFDLIFVIKNCHNSVSNFNFFLSPTLDCKIIKIKCQAC